MIGDTGDNIERILATAVPRKASSQLRAIVMATVAAELTAARGRKRSWHSWVPRAVAATLFFSITTSLTSFWWEARRMAAWDARPVVRSEVAELTAAVAAVSGDETARGVERYLSAHLQQIPAHSAALTMRQEAREIERWAARQPLAERKQNHEEAQDRI